MDFLKHIYCINLKTRKDRKNKVKKQLKKLKLDYNFYIATPHQDPVKGCLESHVNVIKKAKERKLPYVTILEDDIVIRKSINNIPPPPPDWEMLYLGGNVKELLYDLKVSNANDEITYIIYSQTENHLPSNLKDCLESLLSQTCDKWKVIVFISKKDIETKKIIKDYDNNPKITFLEEKFRDINVNIKTCINKSSTDILYLLYSDHKVTPNCTQVVLDTYIKYPCGYIYTDYEVNGKIIKNQIIKKRVSYLESNVNIPFIQSFRKSIYDKIISLKNTMYSDIWIPQLILELETFTPLMYIPQNINISNEIYSDKKINKHIKYILSKRFWKRMKTWMTIGYIIKESLYDKVIEESTKMNVPIDIYYMEHINPNYKCYMAREQIVVPPKGEDYSNIEKTVINYDHVESNSIRVLNEWNVYPNLSSVEKAEVKIVNNNQVLKLPSTISDDELPFVSIVTPTYDRRNFFPLAINNFMNFDYPRDKLEWVIIDDGKENIKDLLPENDMRIKYIKVNSLVKIPIGKKRNMCAEYATHNYILHMDDDDYYPPSSILARIKILMKYNKNKKCVGSTVCGCYNIHEGYLNHMIDRDEYGRESYFCEASMGYTKKFWKERMFGDDEISGEYHNFLRGRQKEMVSVPFDFILLALYHGKNTTSLFKENKDFSKHEIPLSVAVNESTLKILEKMKEDYKNRDHTDEYIDLGKLS